MALDGLTIPGLGTGAQSALGLPGASGQPAPMFGGMFGGKGSNESRLPQDPVCKDAQSTLAQTKTEREKNRADYDADFKKFQVDQETRLKDI